MVLGRRAGLVGVAVVLVLGAGAAAAGAARKPDVHYVPTPAEVAAQMLTTAGVGKGDVVYDLGCGDGRIVIAAIEKFGARKGVGIDIDPARIKECHENARKAGVADRVTFLEQDLYDTDFSEATVVTLYLLPTLNVRLRPVLFRQLRPGDRIVSHAFDMGEWEADKTMQVPCDDGEQRTIHYWVLPAPAGGTWQWTLPGPDGQQAWRLRLRQRFQAVSGTVSVGGQDLPIADAALTGDRLTFGVAREAPEGAKSRMTFRGRLVGNTLAGTVETQGGPAAGTRDWAALRDPVNLAGTWRWTAGDAATTLRIRRLDGRTYASATAGDRQGSVSQFYAWGASVHFILEGSAAQTYEGFAEGDRIVGTVTAEGGAAQEWTAERAKK